MSDKSGKGRCQDRYDNAFCAKDFGHKGDHESADGVKWKQAGAR